MRFKVKCAGGIGAAFAAVEIEPQGVALQRKVDAVDSEKCGADGLAGVVAFEEAAVLVEEADAVGKVRRNIVIIAPVYGGVGRFAVNHDKIHVHGVAAEGVKQAAAVDAFVIAEGKFFAEVKDDSKGGGVVNFEGIRIHIIKLAVFEEAEIVKSAVHSAAFAEVSEFVCGIVFQKYGGERNVAAAVKSAFVQRIFSVGRYLFCEFEIFLFYVAEPCFGGLLFKVHKYIICGVLAGFCGENFCAFIKGYFRRSDFIAFG